MFSSQPNQSNAVPGFVGVIVGAVTVTLADAPCWPDASTSVQPGKPKMRARMTLPADDALDLMGQLGMSRKGEEGALGLLPAPWGVMPGVEVAWWDASSQTPPESYARSYGVNGEMRAKLEGGTLYLIVSDTGWTGD